MTNPLDSQEIANKDLMMGAIAGADADWGAVQKFALSFNAYNFWGSFEKCAEIANAQRHDSLTNLRTCLFFEQRRWRHFGYHPNAEAMMYLREVVEKIRGRVAAGDVA